MYARITVVAVLGTEAPAILVLIDLVRRNRPIAICVESVTEFFGSGMNLRPRVITLKAITDSKPVLIKICLVGREYAVTIRIETITDLSSSRRDGCVAVVAVLR
jgi:hypothetical protein